MSKSSKSPESPESSARPTSSAARPYSFRPQDFGAPERVEKNPSVASDESEGLDEPMSDSHGQLEAAGKGSGERATAHAQPLSSGVSHKVARKEEHTILMAVPPPAQENKGD